MTERPQTATISDGLLGQADALAGGRVSSVELVTSALERIERTQPTLNAFRVVFADRALSVAAEADRRIAGGERLPLLGVPVAIKDDTDVEGETTPFGCGGPFKPATSDARIVSRLRVAGAVVIGKTNAPEIGQWPISDSKAFGIVRNPYNTDHTPGGSSGGSAAAVAAGLVPAAVGSDGGGSVRIPAGWSNLVGLKPQRGRISAYPALDYANGLSVNGPLARTVEDAAALFDVLVGQIHEDERYQSPGELSSLVDAARREPGRLRIAISLNPPFTAAPNALDPRIEAAVRRLADVLSELGHHVEERKIKYGQIGATWIVRGSTYCRSWADAHVPDVKLLDPRSQASLRAGRVLSPLLPAARRAEKRFAARIGQIYDDFDVVLMPTAAEPPLRAGGIDGVGEFKTNAMISKACPYAFAWNVLGWPAVNVPAGFVDGNLPIGAQLLGPSCSEELLISLAAQLEAKERWYEKRPDPTSCGMDSR